MNERRGPVTNTQLAAGATRSDAAGDLGDLPPRIARKISFTDGCWEWAAMRTHNGYGRVRWKNRLDYAHRVLYELLVGPIPAGMQVDHLCRNRPCVRPDHLEVVSQRTNVLRGASFSAANAAKTHCPQGHLYDEANTHVDRRGYRQCKACHRERGRRYYREARSA